MDEILRGTDVVIDAPGAHGRYYQHGWQSWSDTRWLDPQQLPMRNPIAERWPMVDDPAHATSDLHGGSGVGAIEKSAEEIVLLGALGVGGRVTWDGERLVGHCDGPAGEWLVVRDTETEAFTRYGQLLGERLGRRPPRHPRIWCSWYSFYGNIDEARLLGVLHDLEDMPFDVFQVDDGWQRNIGDWHANERFPSGMRALGRRVADAGFEAGLWLAPFLARADASVVRDRPELFARDTRGDLLFAGRNWGGDCLALDLTHPAAQDYVVEAIERAVDAGFTYLKLDFLYAAALPGRRSLDIPREQVYRDAVELIRGAAGDAVYLLACGAPIIPSIGVFDAIRVGPDVAPWWDMPLVTQYLHDPTAPSTRFAIATSLHRLWLAPLIEPDPDVVYFRRRYNLLDRAARSALQDLARICGFRATSDPPSWLDEREREEMRGFFDEDSTVRAVGPHQYEVDGRLVDFRPIAHASPDFRSWHDMVGG